jgi:UV DNA damage endonuclease
MTLGLVCHFVDEVKTKSGSKLVNLFENRTMRLGQWYDGKYSHQKIFDLYMNNVSKVLEMLPILKENRIFSYRLSSELLPLADKVPQELWDNKSIRDTFKQIGSFAKLNGIRLGMHPGQFCVLSSDKEHVVDMAIKDLSIHAWILDQCELDQTPQYSINIHAGSKTGLNRLISVINTLPQSIRGRLVLENCETVANVGDLLGVHQSTKIPICFDSHHHNFNSGSLTQRQAFDIAVATWPSGIKPLQHLSNSEPGSDNLSFQHRRKHSNWISTIPEPQLEALRANEVDVEVEAKMKNLAIAKLREDFSL